jgi:hypothetical protein
VPLNIHLRPSAGGDAILWMCWASDGRGVSSGSQSPLLSKIIIILMVIWGPVGAMRVGCLCSGKKHWLHGILTATVVIIWWFRKDMMAAEVAIYGEGGGGEERTEAVRAIKLVSTAGEFWLHGATIIRWCRKKSMVEEQKHASERISDCTSII